MEGKLVLKSPRIIHQRELNASTLQKLYGSVGDLENVLRKQQKRKQEMSKSFLRKSVILF